MAETPIHWHEELVGCAPRDRANDPRLTDDVDRITCKLCLRLSAVGVQRKRLRAEAKARVEAERETAERVAELEAESARLKAQREARKEVAREMLDRACELFRQGGKDEEAKALRDYANKILKPYGGVLPYLVGGIAALAPALLGFGRFGRGLGEL